MAWRSALFTVALFLAGPVSGKKQEPRDGGGAKPDMVGEHGDERRPVYSPWTDEDSLQFWNADGYRGSGNSRPRHHSQHSQRQTDHGHNEQRQTDHGHNENVQHPQHSKPAAPRDSEIVAPSLPPSVPNSHESVIIMRELMKNLGEEDFKESARLIFKKHSLGDARQAESAVLLREEFDLIKHGKRAPLSEAAVGFGDPALPPMKLPRWPDPTAVRLSQMLGTILDKATREKPSRPVTAPKLRKSR